MHRCNSTPRFTTTGTADTTDVSANATDVLTCPRYM